VGKPETTSSTESPAGQRKTAYSPAERRSSRVKIDMPVEVFGQEIGGKMFQQETRTMVVNAHGALLVLTLGVDIKPSVLLVNKRTSTEVQCRVVYRKEIDPSTSELGIEFLAPRPKFWGISFPPEDWRRSERKMPPSAGNK